MVQKAKLFVPENYQHLLLRQWQFSERKVLSFSHIFIQNTTLVKHIVYIIGLPDLRIFIAEKHTANNDSILTILRDPTILVAW